MKKKFSEFLLQVRERSGWSQEQMGEYLGLSRGMIAQYEGGAWDTNQSSKKRKHEIKLEKLWKELTEPFVPEQKGDLTQIIAEQNQRILKLELDMNMLKIALSKLQRH